MYVGLIRVFLVLYVAAACRQCAGTFQAHPVFRTSTKMSGSSASSPSPWSIVASTRRQRRAHLQPRSEDGRPNNTEDTSSTLSTTTTCTSNIPPVWMNDLPIQSQPTMENYNGIPNIHKPHILLLAGYPGSGKTTLAECLCRVQPWKYVRVNQDDLGSRQKCLDLTLKILASGKCPVIDRCNASRSQRNYFTRLPKTAVGSDQNVRSLQKDSKRSTSTTSGSTFVPVDVVSLQLASVLTCADRCKARQNHPTLQPSDVDSVIAFFSNDWEPPNACKEGFRSLTVVDDEVALRRLVLGLLAE